MAVDPNALPTETLIGLGKLAYQVAHNKETRRDFVKQVKKIDPNYMLPGDQQVEDLRQELAERDEQRAIDAQKAANDARLEAQRRGLLDGTLIKGRRFTDEQVKELEEKVMPKIGVADYDVAARYYLHDLKPDKAKPQPGPGASWTLPDLPGLLDDPAKAARDAAHSIIDEFRGT